MMCQPNWVFTGSEIALAELERHLGEFRDHLVLGEIAEIAALGRAGVLRLFLGERGEIGAAFELARMALASSSVGTRMWRACTSSSFFTCLTASS